MGQASRPGQVSGKRPRVPVAASPSGGSSTGKGAELAKHTSKPRQVAGKRPLVPTATSASANGGSSTANGAELVFDASRCLARVVCRKNFEQCGRERSSGDDLCARHQRELHAAGRLQYGFVDGPVPTGIESEPEPQELRVKKRGRQPGSVTSSTALSDMLDAAIEDERRGMLSPRQQQGSQDTARLHTDPSAKTPSSSSSSSIGPATSRHKEAPLPFVEVPSLMTPEIVDLTPVQARSADRTAASTAAVSSRSTSLADRTAGLRHPATQPRDGDDEEVGATLKELLKLAEVLGDRRDANPPQQTEKRTAESLASNIDID